MRHASPFSLGVFAYQRMALLNKSDFDTDSCCASAEESCLVVVFLPCHHGLMGGQSTYFFKM